MDKSFMEMVAKIVKRADTMGCIFATHIGEMPTRDDIKETIIRSLSFDDFEMAAVHIFIWFNVISEKELRKYYGKPNKSDLFA